MQRRWAHTAAAVALTAGLLVVPKVNVLAAAAQQWVLVPPAGTAVTATVRLDAAGRLSLEVSRGATQVLKPSALGIRTSGADLSTGLTFTGRADSHVTGSYATASGRRSQHTVDANETTLHLAKGKTTVDLVVRVSGDGVGYRYVLPQTGAYTVTGEASEYAVPATARAILLPYD